jgi:hypothetical protein
MNWGHRILFTYLSFALLMGIMVGVAMQQKDLFLVDKEYYKEELAYQTKINQITNAYGLSAPVDFSQHNDQLVVSFPKEAWPEEGTAFLFRPSNATLDKKIALQPSSSGVQTIALGGLEKGLWRLKLSWKHSGRPYYTEHELVVR